MTAKAGSYHPTESKYKGGAQEMYITYDLEQWTRGGGTAPYPRVKRVYIAGDVKDWKTAEFKKRTGREVHGVRIEYEQTRTRYHRSGYRAERGESSYGVGPASVPATSQRFVQVVEVPDAARDVKFYTSGSHLPDRYRSALQRVR